MTLTEALSGTLAGGEVSASTPGAAEERETGSDP